MKKKIRCHLISGTCKSLKNGFVLIEVMLGVMIFAIGVLALGKCVNNCLSAEIATTDDQRARLALQNRMAEIEAGEVRVGDEKTDELSGMFDGMKIRQKKTLLKLKNEKDKLLDNLYVIDLEVSWKSGNEPQSKPLSFYVYQTN